jgi:hypothetical protein
VVNYVSDSEVRSVAKLRFDQSLAIRVSHWSLLKMRTLIGWQMLSIQYLSVSFRCMTGDNRIRFRSPKLNH